MSLASSLAAVRPTRIALDRRSSRLAAFQPSAVLQSAPRLSPPVKDPKTHFIGSTQRESVLTKYGGISAPQLEQVLSAIAAPGLAQALVGAATDLQPAAAEHLVRRLMADLPPAAFDVTPNGDCVLLMLAPGLLPLLERSLEHGEECLGRSQLAEAARTARLLLDLLGRLRFGSRASAAGYADLAMRCKLALKVAYDAGAPILQEDIVDLETACARASPWLWLTPYVGHRCACAVDEFVTQGWATGELAVRFTEAYCALTGRGRYTQVNSKFVRLVRAALKHPLSAAQLSRLLAAADRLPVDMRVALDLHSRSQPEDCWHAALSDRLREAEVGASGKRSGDARRGGGDGAMLNGAVAATVRGAKRGASAAAVSHGF